MPKYIVNKECIIDRKVRIPNETVDINEPWRVQQASETLTPLDVFGNREPNGDSSRTLMTRQTSDLIGNLANTGTGLIYASISAGASATSAGTLHHPGQVIIRGSGTAGGGGRLTSDPAALLISGGETFESIFRFPSNDVNSSALSGFTNSATVINPARGMFHLLTTNGTTLTIQPRCVNSSTVTSGTGYTGAIDAWYRNVITLSADGLRCNFKLYDEAGTVLDDQTLTSNIPLSGTCGAGFLALNTTAIGTAHNILVIDWFDIYTSRRLIR